MIKLMVVTSAPMRITLPKICVPLFHRSQGRLDSIAPSRSKSVISRQRESAVLPYAGSFGLLPGTYAA